MSMHYTKKSNGIVYLVDYKNTNNNDFTIINQWTFIENSEKRPDILLFINGLSLAMFELKSPSSEETDVSEAYRQLRNYMHEISTMYYYYYYYAGLTVMTQCELWTDNVMEF